MYFLVNSTKKKLEKEAMDIQTSMIPYAFSVFHSFHSPPKLVHLPPSPPNHYLYSNNSYSFSTVFLDSGNLVMSSRYYFRTPAFTILVIRLTHMNFISSSMGSKLLDNAIEINGVAIRDTYDLVCAIPTEHGVE